METPTRVTAEPLALKALRIAGLAILSLAAAVFLMMAAIVMSAWIRASIAGILGLPFYAQHFKDSSEWIVAAILVGPILLVAAGVFLLARALKTTSWPAVGLGFAALFATLIYLAHDEAGFRRQIAFQDAALAPPALRESFDVLMRYGKEHPLGKGFKEPPFREPYPDSNVKDHAHWRAEVLTHRDELEAHWVLLAPVRAWWNELDSFETIGDLTAPRPDAEISAFKVFRVLTRETIGTASLQAIDGHGDQAIDTLLPLLRVAIKLQPESRTLVRSMIAVVTERLSLETAGFILDTTEVSPAARARLAEALKGGDPEGGARRLMQRDYAFSQNSLSNKPVGEFIDFYDGRREHAWLRWPLNLASAFIYNPKSTFNTYSLLSDDLQDYVGKRELAKMAPRMDTFLKEDAKPRFKNLMGMLLLGQIVPSYRRLPKTTGTRRTCDRSSWRGSRRSGGLDLLPRRPHLVQAWIYPKTTRPS